MTSLLIVLAAFCAVLEIGKRYYRVKENRKSPKFHRGEMDVVDRQPHSPRALPRNRR